MSTEIAAAYFTVLGEVLVIPTDEELEIATQTVECIQANVHHRGH